MRIGVSELIVVLIVALLVLGPDKLPRYARKFGAALAEFRKASDEATREIRENVVEPLEEAQRPLREAMEPVEELDRAIQGNLNEVRTSFEQIGKKPLRTASAPDTVPEPVTPAPESEPVASATPDPESKSVAADVSV